MKKLTFEKLKNKMVELIDEYFPKGHKERGKAIAMMARFLIELEKETD